MSNKFNENIPKQFYSDSNNTQFTECSLCKKSLLSEFYKIEKSIRKYSNSNDTYTAYECAICFDCQKQMLKEISDESLSKMQAYLQTHQFEIEKVLKTDKSLNLEQTLSVCSFTKTPVYKMEEYNLVGMFHGNKLIEFPLVIGADIIEEYQELLSDETKEFLDDFMDKITDLPPSLKRLMNTTKKTIIF